MEIYAPPLSGTNWTQVWRAVRGPVGTQTPTLPSPMKLPSAAHTATAGRLSSENATIHVPAKGWPVGEVGATSCAAAGRAARATPIPAVPSPARAVRRVNGLDVDADMQLAPVT